MIDVFDTVLEVLNSAYAADPAAIHALCCNRVPCNQALADHPHVVVEVAPIGVDNYNVGLLEVINGVTEALTGRRVASRWVNNVLVGFVEYTPSDV